MSFDFEHNISDKTNITPFSAESVISKINNDLKLSGYYKDSDLFVKNNGVYTFDVVKFNSKELYFCIKDIQRRFFFMYRSFPIFYHLFHLIFLILLRNILALQV